MSEGRTTDIVTQQLTAIHAMLSAGHRNLRIERHTLVLWGLAGGALLMLSESILTPMQIPPVEQRALAWLLLLSATIGAVSAADWRLTTRVKRQRDEAWSFIHRQIFKVWWMLMGIGALLTFATFFFGGGYMVCAAWVVLVGIGLYVHGLFSDELVEWVGALAVVIGIASLGFRLDYQATRLIAASVFGVGLPLLAAMLDRCRGGLRPVWRRAALVVVWLLAVLGLPLLAFNAGVTAVVSPAAPTLSLDAFRHGEGAVGRWVVNVPAGTIVPLQVRVTGDLFREERTLRLPLTLAARLDVGVNDGAPTGDIRLAGEQWQAGDRAVWLRIDGLKAALTAEHGPLVHANIDINLRDRPRDR